MPRRMQAILQGIAWGFAGLVVLSVAILVVTAVATGPDDNDAVAEMPARLPTSTSPTPVARQVSIPIRDVIQSYEPLCGPFPTDPRWEAEKYPVTMHPYKDFLYPYVTCWPIDSLQIEVSPASDSTHLGTLTLFIHLDRIDDEVVINEIAVPIVGMLAGTVNLEKATRDDIGKGLYQQVYDPQFTEGHVCTRMENGQPVSRWCPGSNIPVSGKSAQGVLWDIHRVDWVASVWLRVRE